MGHDDPLTVVLAAGNGAVLLDVTGPLQVFALATGWEQAIGFGSRHRPVGMCFPA